jgi:hypothetical protein
MATSAHSGKSSWRLQPSRSLVNRASAFQSAAPCLKAAVSKRGAPVAASKKRPCAVPRLWRMGATTAKRPRDGPALPQ